MGVCTLGLITFLQAFRHDFEGWALRVLGFGVKGSGLGFWGCGPSFLQAFLTPRVLSTYIVEFRVAIVVLTLMICEIPPPKKNWDPVSLGFRWFGSSVVRFGGFGLGDSRKLRLRAFLQPK